MPGIHLSKSGAANYPVSLHLGCYTIPVEKDVITSLKEDLSKPPESFLEKVIEKTSNNSYIHDLIRRELNKAEDVPQQISGLQEFVRNFQEK